LKNKEEIKNKGIEGVTAHTSQFKALSIDYNLYEHYLESSDLTETQKRDFLEALWSIIVNFVDLGFEVHPLQQVCEQNSLNSIHKPTGVVKSSKQISQKAFSNAADRSNNGLLGRT
tara:strand:- start:715 stop:1062 length:348 start_codon:yes stop_codon:yes gene_type:complete